VKCFCVITNYTKDANAGTTDLIKNYIEQHGGMCYVQSNGVVDKSQRYKYTDASRIPPEVEGVLVLGGDGTLLQASRDLVGTGLPLLGINMGTLGYLAEIEHQNILPALDSLMADEYTIEERMMLKGAAYHHSRKLMEDMALNDIVIGRRGRLRVVDFNIYVDDVFLCSYRADGFIVSTPTGSTGYSLSAGGPIVSPDASLMLLTAVAPHTLNSRSIILPDHVQVTVTLGGRPGGSDGAEATFDGDTSVKLDAGGSITIGKSEQKTYLIKINHTSFVENLRDKMK